MNEELNMETMEEMELEAMDDMEVSEESSKIPFVGIGIGLGLLGIGIACRKKIETKLEEANVNRLVKKGYIVYKNEDDLDASDQEDSEDVE